jgi:hypothetical protein
MMPYRVSDTCEIVVKGQLDPNWSEWLEGLRITHNDKGQTVISGPIRDQAALYGILVKMRDMVLFLISVKYIVAESFKENSDWDDSSQVQ